jgi:hypothetical protein
MGEIDLSGRWTGVYFYPEDAEFNANDNLPATPFTAELSDRNGHVTGTTLEPDLLGSPGAPPITATIEGDRLGGRLIFTKFPEGDRQTHTIDYDGDISEDGDTIEGRWIIHGDWSGAFRMQRRTLRDTAEAQQRVEADIRAR